MRLLTPTLALLLSLGSTSLSAADYLSGEELTALASGNTAYCRHLQRPSQGRTYYNPDGTMHGIRRGEPREGTWHVTGDTLCTDWGAGPICSRFQSDGQGGHYKFMLDGRKVVHVWQWGVGDRVHGEPAGAN